MSIEDATVEDIFKYITTIHSYSDKVALDMVKRRFRKTHSEAQQLVWAYQLEN